MRKHYTQMKAAEIEVLESQIRKVCNPELAGHAADRMQQKGVTAKEITNAIRYGQVIEIHNEADELRVVVRHAYGKPKVAVCVVIGLESGTVVTTWKNAGSDNHKTINMLPYQWKQNVVQLLQAGA